MNNQKADKPIVSFTDLPNEIIDKIFDYVSFDDLFNLELVNKRINKVVKEISFPKIQTLDHKAIIKFTNYPEISIFESQCEREDKNFKLHKINNKSIETILTKANIHSIDLSIYHEEVTNEICAFFKLAPQLLQLDISLFILEVECLYTIAEYCPLLEEFSMEECFRDHEKIDNAKGLKFLFDRCERLRYLNISYNNFDNGCLEYIPFGLRYLNLASCFDINATTMDIMVNRAKDLETLIIGNYFPDINFNARLRKLKKLRFLEVAYAYNDEDVDDFPLMDFSNLMELEMLNINENEYVTNEALQTLSSCPKLKALTLDLLEGYESIEMTILEKCKQLKYLNLCVRDDGYYIPEFVQNIKLQYLAINHCRKMPQHLLDSLIQDCHSLTHLEIYETNGSNNIGEVLRSPKFLNRSNVLNVVVKKGDKELPENKMYKIHSCKMGCGETFFDYTNVYKQYYK